MDDALKNPNQRRKKKNDGRSLEDDADSKIEGMRDAMTRAAQADTVARENGQPAMEKLKLLPQVTSLLNNNTMQSQLVDPEHNLLEAVRFFLEPLNDGSLPAYNIQKDLFAALGRLPINKDSLVASGIGKVVYFYTKSKRPEVGIKRQADRLMADWLRLVLKRSGDYKNRELGNNNAYVYVIHCVYYLLT
jgi:transcription factor SPN1